jgi:hypothetical protein
MTRKEKQNYVLAKWVELFEQETQDRLYDMTEEEINQLFEDEGGEDESNNQH